MSELKQSVTAAQTLPTDTVSKLWRLMTEVFGYRWASAYGTTDQSGTWSKGLAGLTAEDIGRGVRRVIDLGMEWPPSLPEFRKLCEPDEVDLGLPTMDQAYRAASRRDWSLHPAVYHAAKIVGVWDLEQKPEHITRPRFADAWESIIKRIRSGEMLEGPIDAPRIERSKESRQAYGRHHLENIRQMLKSNPSQGAKA
jgi:hypothetical protein